MDVISAFDKTFFPILTLHRFYLIRPPFGHHMQTSPSQEDLAVTRNRFVILLCMLVLVILNRNIIASLIRFGPTMSAVTEIIRMLVVVSIGILLGTLGFGTKSKKQVDIPLNLDADESPDSLKDNASLDQYNSSEQFIIEFLLEKENKCWQSDIVKNSDMTKSKISRTLSSLESKGLVSRVRDGMGNRVILDVSELF
jgi:uncharacterized membrane protein